MTRVRAAAILALIVICTSCGQTYRPVATPIIPNPPNPDFTHLEFVVTGNGPSHPGASTAIDVSGDTAVSQATVGLLPVHLAVVQNGFRVFVANSGDGTVSSFAPSSPTPVITVALPEGPFPAVPVFVHTTQNDLIWIADAANGRVDAILANNNVVGYQVPVGTNPVSLAETPNQLKLYSANMGLGGTGGSVTSINPSDRSVNPPILNATWVSPVSVASRADSGRVYVLDQGTGMVSAIDPVSDSVVNSVSVGVGANFMLYDPKRNRIYVSNPAANTVTYLDASTDALTPVVIPVLNPISITALPDGTRAYVTSGSVSGGNVISRVTVINASNGSIRSTIPLTSAAQVCASNPSELSIAAAADSSRVYVGNCDAGNVAIILTASDSLLLQMPAPVSAAQPSTIAISGVTQTGANTTYAYTLASGPSLRVGMSVAIQSMDDAGNDGTFTILALGAGTFTVSNPTGVAASSQHGSGTAVTPQNPVFVVLGT